MANEIQVLQSKVRMNGDEFAKALPAEITVERFIRTTQTAIAMTRGIDKLKSERSLMLACVKAAADGLILDGREAALVIDQFGEAQYWPMLRGLLKLAHNSGQIKSLVVEVARENDDFDYEPTRSGEPIIHKIDLRAERGEPFAFYAIAELVGGGIVHDVMTLSDVNRIRDRSSAWRAFKAGKIKSTPWSTDHSEMARKTVFRRLSKYLPASADNRMHQAAERFDEDFTTIDEPGDDTAPAPRARKARGGAAAALKDITPPKAKPATEPPPQDDEHDPETGEIIDHDDDAPEQRDSDPI